MSATTSRRQGLRSVPSGIANQSCSEEGGGKRDCRLESDA